MHACWVGTVDDHQSKFDSRIRPIRVNKYNPDLSTDIAKRESAHTFGVMKDSAYIRVKGDSNETYMPEAYEVQFR
jgi:hypothetical protein